MRRAGNENCNFIPSAYLAQGQLARKSHVHVIAGGLSDPRCLDMIALEWPELALG